MRGQTPDRAVSAPLSIWIKLWALRREAAVTPHIPQLPGRADGWVPWLKTGAHFIALLVDLPTATGPQCI